MDKGTLEAVIIASDNDDTMSIKRDLHYEKDPENGHTTWYGTDGHLLFVVNTPDEDVELEHETGAIRALDLAAALKPFKRNHQVKLKVKGKTIETPSATFAADCVEDTDELDKLKRYISLGGEPFIALATDVLDKLVKALKKTGCDYVYFASESKALDQPLSFYTDRDKDGLRGVIMPCRWQ